MPAFRLLTSRQHEERRITLRAALILTLLVAGTNTLNRAAADEVTGELVERLVQRLDSDRLPERVAAERKLRALGPAVLPHLPAPGRAPSAAARDAVRRVREILERTQAEQSVRPSRVTLNGTHSLREVVHQIVTQTGNTIRTTSLSPETLKEPLSCEWQQEAFWDCLEAIGQRPQLAVRFRPVGGILEIVPESSVDEPAVATSHVGAFRIAVRHVTLRPDFTDRKRKVIRVRYDVAAEPRLRPLFVRVSNADFVLTASDPKASGSSLNDPSGNDPSPDKPSPNDLSRSDPATNEPVANGPTAGGDVSPPLDKNARRERPADRPGPVPLSTDFVVSRDWTGDSVRMTGRIEIEVATGQEAFVFRNLRTAERIVRRRGGVTVTLDRAVLASGKRPDAGTVTIDLRVAYDQGGPAFESHRTWVYHNDAFLRLPGGTSDGTSDGTPGGTSSGPPSGTQRWSHSGFDTQAAAEAAVKLSYRFEDVPTDAKGLEFVYIAPTLLLTVPVPIELPNIPIEAPPAGQP